MSQEYLTIDQVQHEVFRQAVLADEFGVQVVERFTLKMSAFLAGEEPWGLGEQCCENIYARSCASSVGKYACGAPCLTINHRDLSVFRVQLAKGQAFFGPQAEVQYQNRSLFQRIRSRRKVSKPWRRIVSEL